MATETIDANDENAVLARAAEIQTERAARAAAERSAYLKPLADLIASPAWAEVRDAARALQPTYAADTKIAVHLNPLADFMSNLTSQLPPVSVTVA